MKPSIIYQHSSLFFHTVKCSKYSIRHPSFSCFSWLSISAIIVVIGVIVESEFQIRHYISIFFFFFYTFKHSKYSISHSSSNYFSSLSMFVIVMVGGVTVESEF